MRPTPFRRCYTAVAVSTLLGLFGVILATTSSAPAVEAQSPIEPQFFEWEDEPFTDGLNHYLVTVAGPDSSEPGGWLRVDDTDTLVADDTDTLVADDTRRVSVAPDDIDAIMNGSEPTVAPREVVPEEVARGLLSHEEVDEVAALGFGIFAVSGSIDSRTLETLPGVSSVSIDPALTAATVDPYFPSQWGLDNDGSSTDPWAVTADADIDAPQAWHRTRGSGVVVAVIDSGVDTSHPDLVNNIWHNPDELCGNTIDDDANGYVDDCTGWDFANRTGSVVDYVGHGTHVAGIIAAEANNEIGVAGVAYESEIMPLKMGDTSPALSAGIEAIAYAIDNGARVINASWGVSDPNAAVFLDTAIAAARDAGVLFVTAAGNVGANIDSTPTYPASSTLDNVLTVGASTSLDTPASWSSYGETSVDIYAPGEYIISTVPGGYDIYSGTSMAAPMVTAAAALLWSATPEATYAEVKVALMSRSDGPNDGVTAFRGLSVSEGRLNVDRAVYTAPLFQPPVMYEFYDFNSFPPDTMHNVKITAKTVDPWKAPPQHASIYRVGLYVPYQGQPMAVVGQPIAFTGVGGEMVGVTDETGQALVGHTFDPEERHAFVQDGDPTELEMALPAGTYAFVMELIDVIDPETPIAMGDPAAVFFIVGNDGSIAEMPQLPIGGSPHPTTTTFVPPVTSTPPTTGQSTSTTLEVTTTTGPGPSVTSTTTTTVAPPTTAPTTAAAPATTAPSTTSVPTTTMSPAPTTTVPQPTTTSAPSSTTTTAVPATTTPPQASTTTSAPPVTTTTTPPTTTTSAPDAMTISGVNPTQGPVSGHTLVTITGRDLPERPTVYFGERTGEVIASFGGTFVVVDTPAGDAGAVDVRVIDPGSGEEAMLDDAFTYVAGDDGPAPTTTQPTTSTTSAPGTTTSLPPGTVTAPPTTNPIPGSDFGDWRDSLLITPEGLTLAPIPPDNPMAVIPLDVWVGALCDQPICPGWVLDG